MANDNASANKPKESPLSLSRLREAFAAMMGEATAEEEDRGAHDAATPRSRVSPKLESGSLGETALRGIEISPRSVIEALLFVGRPDNGAFSSRELAAAMRGVSPAEIDAAVGELNLLYDEDESPYLIEGTSAGYRLVLRADFQRMRDKFYGTVREAKLSPAALEVLSIIAYNQPVTAERINELRNAPNGAAISTLVRRQIVRLDRPAEAGAKPRYSTTERFLKLFRLESLAALPRSEEVAAG
ncbi:MAG: SMC-Scp complex subunit ScpB [Planctomycetes bacterium]|nr:SMC-Scp complex subunit ScpB [Planctomycetota bacterium]